MTRTYSNPWIPEEALQILDAQRASILDVGGGAAPYFRATHVLDVLPFSAERLSVNAWGVREVESRRSKVTTSPGPRREGEDGKEKGEEPGEVRKTKWSQDGYTQLDLCGCRAWPFEDNAFDLGLSSHCLEDLRDPLPAVREMSRVCRKSLIIVPSRLIEQTRGVDHPRYCGFPHHPWIVSVKGTTLVFRRKTFNVMLPACHIVCPAGRTLRRELGCTFAYGETFDAEEDPAVWDSDYEDYCRFIEPFRRRRDLFVHDGKPHGVKYWVWKARERWFGAT